MMFVWVFLVVIIIAAMWYFGKNKNQFNSSPKKENAIDLLKRRFASGEVDEEEYEERKALLEDEHK